MDHTLALVLFFVGAVCCGITLFYDHVGLRIAATVAVATGLFIELVR